MKKRLVRGTSMLLVLTMILSIPSSTLAESIQQGRLEETANQPILLEDQSTEYETYYQNPDGSFTYEANSAPVRYKDENGQWQDIQNDIIPIDRSEDSQDAFRQQPYQYRTRASKNWVLFSEDLNAESIIKLEGEEYSIASKPVRQQSRAEVQEEINEPLQQTEEAAVQEGETQELEDAAAAPMQAETQTQAQPVQLPSQLLLIPSEESLEKETPLKKSRDLNTQEYATYQSAYEYQTVEYTNVFANGVHLRVTPVEDGYKEDIVLTEKPADNRFSFEIQVTGGMTLHREETGTVYIKDTAGEIKGVMPQPFLLDSTTQEEYENLSYDVEVELEDRGNGSYLYTLIPSREYLDDEDTIYPVILDPTTTITGASSIRDTDVNSKAPGTNYYTSANLRVGQDTSGAKFRSFVAFDIPSAVASSYISSADIGTYQAYNGTTNPPISTKRVASNWTSSTMTWNNQPSIGETRGTQNVKGVGWYWWNITKNMRQWIWGEYPNYGIAFVSNEENIARYKRFNSSDNASNKIKISIIYYNKNITASAKTGSINSNKGSITVNWPSMSGKSLTYKVYMDGVLQATLSSGTSYTISNVDATKSHKVFVEYMDTHYYSAGRSNTVTVNMPDTTSPAFSGAASAAISEDLENVVLSFNPATDPSGISKHEIYWVNQAGTRTLLQTVTPAQFPSNKTFTYNIEQNGFPPEQSMHFEIRAFDTKNNYTTTYLASNNVDIPNNLGPRQPNLTAYRSIDGAEQSYTHTQSPSFQYQEHATVGWDIQMEEGSEYALGYVQYKMNDGPWTSIDEADMLLQGAGTSIAQNRINIVLPLEGQNTLSIRGIDSNTAQPIVGKERSIVCIKDATAPQLTVAYPEAEGEIPTWTNDQKVQISTCTDANLKSIQIEMGPKSSIMPPIYQTVATYDAQTSVQYPIEIPLSGLDINHLTFGIRITATDMAGNQTVQEKYFNLIASDSTYYAREVKLTGDAEDEGMEFTIRQPVKTFHYEPVGDFALPENYSVELYTGNARVPQIQVDQSAKTITVDVTHPDNLPLFQNGDRKTIYIRIVDENDPSSIIYSAPTTWGNERNYSFHSQGDIDAIFESTTNLQLDPDGSGLVNITDSEGYVECGFVTKPQMITNDKRLVRINLKNIGNTDLMSYQFFDGEEYSQPVSYVGHELVVVNNAKDVKGYKITGIMREHYSGSLHIDQFIMYDLYLGQANTVQVRLVEPATNLSAMPLANYTTWLRWEPSATEGTVYDVYRSQSETFDPDSAQKIAQDLTDTYFYDYNLMHGQTFHYWVVAKKDFPSGEAMATVESAPCAPAAATMVEEAEVDKYLGLQNYWSYMTTPVGNGTGYVNIAGGNLVYQKSDFANTAPLLASIMRRTYNSQATSTSGLGRGWDFGFNTNLLIEYGADPDSGETIETGILLKDGDGTLHRYMKQSDGSYQSPDGIFLYLDKLDNGTYRATRSDDIVYIFNQNMFIESFSEPNGNQLKFTYDDRGRLIKVMHSLYDSEDFTEQEKQYITFEYGEAPHNQDKIIKAVNYFGQQGGTIYQQEYLYEYIDDRQNADYGMLENVSTTTVRTVHSLLVEEDSDAYVSADVPITTTESYTYQQGEGLAFTVTTPSNQQALTDRTFAFQLDAQKRVSGFTNEENETTAITYGAAGTGFADSIQKTTAQQTIQDKNVGQSEFYTDSAKHGVVVETRSVGDRRVYYSNFNASLQPQTITSHRDAARTQPVVSTLTYDALGNVTSIIDPAGIRTEYTYQQDTSWMTSTKVFEGQTLLNRAEFTYDAHGNLLTEKTAVSNPSAFTDIRQTTYTYNAQGLMTSKTEWNGKQTNYTYDSFGRLQQTEVIGAGKNLKTQYTYDGYNNLSTQTLVRSTGNITTQYHYDMQGYLTHVEYADGRIEAKTYNKNNLATEDIVLGFSGNQFVEWQKNEYTYDELGRELTAVNDLTTAQSTLTYSDNAATASVTVTGNGITRQSSTTVAYDASYQTEMMGGRGVKYLYDYAGNMVQASQISSDGTESRKTYAVYDILGQLTRTYDETNAVESYTDYDALGNVHREWTYVKTEGDVRKYTVKEYTHDLLGRITQAKEYTGLHARGDALTDAPSQVTAYTYDTYDAIAGEYYSTVTDAEGGVTRTYANNLGQTTREIQYGRASGENDPKIIREWVYDDYARQTAVKEGSQVGQTTTKQTYEYDAYDRLVKQTTDSDNDTTYEYDHFGRRKKMTDHTDGENIVTTWVYNKKNQVLQMVQDEKIVNFDYNAVGEMTEIEYGSSGTVRTIRYQYDDNGVLTAVKSGDLLDGAGDMKTVKAYAYAPNGDLQTTTEYLEFDTKADQTGLTMVGTYTYDALGRPTQLCYTQNNVEKEKYTQTYDGRGYITQSTYTDGYGAAAQTTARTYTYDAIGRMTAATVQRDNQQKSFSYQYDKTGNRLYESVTEDNQTTTSKYTYNTLSQLTKVEKGAGAAGSVSNWLLERTLSYDTYGNQTAEQVYTVDTTAGTSTLQGEFQYTYDPANQLIKTEQKLAGQSSYTEQSRSVYNGEGQRIRVYENGEDDYTQYFYIGGALAFTAKGAESNIQQENILDPSGTIIASQRENQSDNQSKYWIYHYDAQGSVTNIIGADAQGALYRAENNVYDPFGNLETGQTTIKNNLKYTGAVQDAGGLYYLGARHYDPNTGRFLQQDTYKGDAYSPWTQNLYAYTSNNPVNYVDPTGHSWVDSLAAAFGAVKDALNQVKNKVQSMMNTSTKTPFGGGKGSGSGVGRDFGSQPQITAKNVQYYQANGRTTTNMGTGHLSIGESSILNSYLENNRPRYIKMKDDPSFRNIMNWLTIGVYDRAFHNENPLSIDHWLANIELFSFGLMTYNSSVSYLKNLKLSSKYSGKIIYGSSAKSSAKISSQMTTRGWPHASIKEAVNNPFTTRVSKNMATGNPATVYYLKDGSYVILDDYTREIIQLSNRLDDFIPDKNIINPYRP